MAGPGMSKERYEAMKGPAMGVLDAHRRGRLLHRVHVVPTLAHGQNAGQKRMLVATSQRRPCERVRTDRGAVNNCNRDPSEQGAVNR